MTMLRKLTDRQRRFVREYLVDLNGTRAAIRAGYSRRGAGSRGWTLRQTPAVAAELEAAMAERARVTGITADRVLLEIALLGFANIQDYIVTGEDGAAWLDPAALTREQAAAIAEVRMEEGGKAGGGAVRDTAARGPRRVRVKLADKSRNLELIGRHLGLFPRTAPRVTPKGEDGVEGEGAAAAELELSDVELHQGVLRILARGQMREAG